MKIVKVALELEIYNAEATLLYQIAATEARRVDVAKTYAMALRSPEKTDWSIVNRAIVDRWSLYALRWIKRLAYSGKCFEAPP